QVYRINVGGTTIDPKDDTGMFRSWTDQDDHYLTENLGSVLPVNWSSSLVFDHIPEYAAPANVYRTARSLGTDRSTTTTYYLTWSFPVDPNFLYLVRLHFCEFQREISKFGDRTFEIYIASLVADSKADVIRWTGGRGIPIYKDYAVDMFAPTSKKINLTVSLHTGPEQYSVYADALLNGVEVFKISSDNRNLAGQNPDPTRVPDPPQQPPERTSSSSGISKNVIAAIAAGSASGALVFRLLCFLTFWSRRSSKDSTYTDKTSLWGPLLADLCRRFSLAEIKAATNGFDEIFIIGVGGFGNVYKGCVEGGSTTVAIKRLNPGSQQGVREFMTEIEMLSQLRHLHLVSLIGYCNDGGEMTLVYDYMSHGTLRDHLYNTENPPLSWKQRLEICLGAPQGLQYLHMGTKHVIIHRDIKTTNILLDEKFEAKVSDFGLSKMRTSDTSHISTMVKGTFGYLDPEYFRFHQQIEKSDVYSFGVVLLEVLCARPPVNTNLETEEIGLAGWVQSCYQNGSLDQIIDPNLKAEIKPECLEKFAETAMSCLRDEGMKRPSMNDIVWSLEHALELPEGAVQQETIALEPTSAMDGRLQGAEDTKSLPDMESEEEVLIIL
ncbi:receptor-like protein kinase FERONIA, partial [Punica granatum]|uniref:Receptor-like protein kinase FERONIA n=1 Tax=Punica granatum TaxID=22663 RepID=A0A6P8D7Z8_PUNGR